MAKVNIFIPVYNGEKYLAETVRSILSQTFTDFTALFVDDGSDDRSVEILQGFADIDSRVVVLEKPHEGSVPFAWNYIFPRLDAEWTLYMSHDDLLEASLLQSLVDKQAETGADAVIPSCHFFSQHPGDDAYTEKNKANDMTGRSLAGCISGREAFGLMLDYSIPGFVLWRTSIIKEIGMPTESYNSDEGMQRIWVNECGKVAFSSDKFYYRLTPGSITKGLKPYHYNSLLTNSRLLDAARSGGVSQERIRLFQYHCINSLLYLKSQFKNSTDSLSAAEQDNIKNVFKTVFPVFSKKVAMPRCGKELILYISAINRLCLEISVSLFAKRLKG